MSKMNHKVYDQTLAEVDKKLEAKKALEKPRHYLGMSQIGEECRRKLFYSFRNAESRVWNASGVKNIEDGFAQEDVMAERLRMLPYIEMHTKNKEGDQIGFKLLLDHFRGHCDGMIKGIKEAPLTWHVWEHKSVNETKFNKIDKLRQDIGEKKTLLEWDIIYYEQAQIYMHEAKLEKHYLTVTSPGGRQYVSVRTDYSRAYAESIIEKANVIIFDNWVLPARLSEKREFYKCKWCEFQGLCHDRDIPQVNCKTCRYREPIKDGKNKCLKKDSLIEETTLNMGNCPEHIFNPALIQAKLLEQQADCCLYLIEDIGFKFANCSRSGLPELKDDIQEIYTSIHLREKIKSIDNISKETVKVQEEFDGKIESEKTGKLWEESFDPRLIGL